MSGSCFQCRYFFVTWDQNHPRGCRAYQFKSKELPAIVVKRTSGYDCLKFEQKQGEGLRG